MNGFDERERERVMFPLKQLSMICVSVRCRHLLPVLLPTSPEHHIRPPVGESRVCSRGSIFNWLAGAATDRSCDPPVATGSCQNQTGSCQWLLTAARTRLAAASGYWQLPVWFWQVTWPSSGCLALSGPKERSECNALSTTLSTRKYIILWLWIYSYGSVLLHGWCFRGF